jgi:putative transposase
VKPTREPFRSVLTTYFVSSQIMQRRMLLRSERWARLFIEILYRYRAKDLFKLHAFVVMPEHFHLLITPSVTLERAVQYIKGGFSREATLRFNWNFAVWQRGFSDHRIRDSVDCDHHVQYIFRNPVKRRLVVRPTEYPFCSAFRGFEVDELPQGLKPEWFSDFTARLCTPAEATSSSAGDPAEAVPLQNQEPCLRLERMVENSILAEKPNQPNDSASLNATQKQKRSILA